MYAYSVSLRDVPNTRVTQFKNAESGHIRVLDTCSVLHIIPFQWHFTVPTVTNFSHVNFRITFKFYARFFQVSYEYLNTCLLSWHSPTTARNRFASPFFFSVHLVICKTILSTFIKVAQLLTLVAIIIFVAFCYSCSCR